MDVNRKLFFSKIDQFEVPQELASMRIALLITAAYTFKNYTNDR